MLTEVLLILMADDIAQADLDQVPTPNIDALAAEGVTFRKTYSMPACGDTCDDLLRVVRDGPPYKPLPDREWE